jgi:hypothetical protein
MGYPNSAQQPVPAAGTLNRAGLLICWVLTKDFRITNSCVLPLLVRRLLAQDIGQGPHEEGRGSLVQIVVPFPQYTALLFAKDKRFVHVQLCVLPSLPPYSRFQGTFCPVLHFSNFILPVLVVSLSQSNVRIEGSLFPLPLHFLDLFRIIFPSFRRPYHCYFCNHGPPLGHQIDRRQDKPCN